MIQFMVNRKGATHMVSKQRGIDLMKKVSEKQAADLRLVAADNERHYKKTGRRPTL